MKTMIIVALVSMLFGLAVAVPLCMGECSSPPRTVTVHATVTDDSGQAVTGIAIVVSCGTEKDGFARLTDAQGHADISIVLGTTPKTLYVAIQPSAPSLGDADNDVAMQNHKTKVDTKSVTLPRMIPVVESQNDYSVTVGLKQACTISGRIVDSAGNAVGGYVERRGSRLPVVAKSSDGQFVLTGVPRGEASELLVSRSSSQSFRIVTLSATQTAADGSIGDIVIDPPSPNASHITVQASKWEKAGKWYEGISPAAVVVNDNCTVIRQCVLSRSVVDGIKLMQGTVDVPAGHYFVWIGSGSVNPYFWALTSVLRGASGSSAATDMGVVSVQVGEGASVPCPVDVEAGRDVYAALRSYW